jgi:hypothetical protein
MPPAGHDDLGRHLLPASGCDDDWNDGGGEMGGSSIVAPPASAAPLSGATALVVAAAAPLLGVPGADSHRNGTAPARRL